MKSDSMVPVQKITQTTSEGTLLTLTYSISCHASEDPLLPLYGICVRLQKDSQKDFEEAHTPPISHSLEYVQDLLSGLIRGSVTPSCLLEVLDELISRNELPDR